MDKKYSSAVIFRRPNPDDINDLYRMVLESTAGKTKLTTTSLRDDLFNLNRNYNPEVRSEDPCINFSLEPIQSDKPVAQAILAEKDNNMVGYVMFHYYFSANRGRFIFVSDLFTMIDHRRKGIAKDLMEAVFDQVKNENLRGVVFNAGYINKDLINKALEYGFEWFRTDSTIRRVLRIEFN